MTSITLPTGHSLERYNLSSPGYGGYRPSRGFTRQVYAAAHVVVDPSAETDPWTAKPALDWEATMAYRRHLWSMGFKVAEAMDTSQRGMGLDWPSALELIRRSLEAARDVPGADLASGAGTDHLTDFSGLTLDDVRRAFIEQIEAVEKLGGRIILMASRALAAVATGPDDYLKIYGELIDGCREPAGWARSSTRPWRATGAVTTSTPARTRCCRSSRPTRPRWRASRSRSWRNATRSTCANACPRPCSCTPGTTSTTRS
jgi:hypothetical protein